MYIVRSVFISAVIAWPDSDVVGRRKKMVDTKVGRRGKGG